jgi:two-component system, response regulator
MNAGAEPIMILMAEDDAGDRMLTRKALERSHLANELRCVEDGEELLAFLRGEGQYAAPQRPPRPGVILLDLNMPRKDGREALREIKSDPALRQIPVLVLTTSKDEEDIYRSYDLGANSYITKPVTLDGLVEVMKSLGSYWFQIVHLPPESSGG